MNRFLFRQIPSGRPNTFYEVENLWPVRLLVALGTAILAGLTYVVIRIHGGKNET
jgi:hypothetical protein